MTLLALALALFAPAPAAPPPNAKFDYRPDERSNWPGSRTYR